MPENKDKHVSKVNKFSFMIPPGFFFKVVVLCAKVDIGKPRVRSFFATVR